jgi:hypothetical protein
MLPADHGFLAKMPRRRGKSKTPEPAGPTAASIVEAWRKGETPDIPFALTKTNDLVEEIKKVPDHAKQLELSKMLQSYYPFKANISLTWSPDGGVVCIRANTTERELLEYFMQGLHAVVTIYTESQIDRVSYGGAVVLKPDAGDGASMPFHLDLRYSYATAVYDTPGSHKLRAKLFSQLLDQIQSKACPDLLWSPSYEDMKVLAQRVVDICTGDQLAETLNSFGCGAKRLTQ